MQTLFYSTAAQGHRRQTKVGKALNESKLSAIASAMTAFTHSSDLEGKTRPAVRTCLLVGKLATVGTHTHAVSLP